MRNLACMMMPGREAPSRSEAPNNITFNCIKAVMKWILVAMIFHSLNRSHSFINTIKSSSFSQLGLKTSDMGSILLLDHLNLNHERSRHDLVKLFYVDILGLSLDPRKSKNIEETNIS